MIKMILCIYRRPDLPGEEFRRYWLEEHGPKVREVAESIGATRYVQSHRVADEIAAAARKPRGSAPPLDGIAEIWWDSVEALQSAAYSAEAEQAHKALIEDEARFVDLARSTVFIAEEHEIFSR